MIAEIHNLKELNSLNRDLQCNDFVSFTTKKEIIKYKVNFSYLLNVNFASTNSIIFNILGMSREEKHSLAEKCYGYKYWGDDLNCKWPEYKRDDYKALEKLIREIYRRLDDNIIGLEHDSITSRFEILDL